MKLLRQRMGMKENDRWGRAVEGVPGTALLEALYRSWFRVEWEGLENIPKEGGALLVCNHAGMMPVDGALVQFGVERERSRRVYMLAHHGFFAFPYVGRVLNRFGAVVAHPNNAHRLLREDRRLVLVFPEGEKGPVKPPSERYRLQRFGRGGFVETAMRAHVPVVPVVLMGTEDTTPTLARLSVGGQSFPITPNFLLFGPILGPLAHFPAKIRARVLPPIDVNGVAESRSVVMDHAESIRGEMQSALDEMYASRESRWFG